MVISVSTTPMRNISRTFFSNTYSRLVGCLVGGLALNTLHAEVKMPGIFGDHMVLQQAAKLPIWGWAAAGETVTVTFAKRTARTTAASDGSWRVDLPAVSATEGDKAETLVITGSQTARPLVFSDVLVGEVWVASGQSNMEFSLRSDSRAADMISQARDSRLRLFFVPWKTALKPQPDIASAPADSPNGKWQICTPEMLQTETWGYRGFSAVAYYFARELRQATGQPVGMIGSYKGATAAEVWTSVESLRKEPELSRHVADHERYVAGFAEASAAFPSKMAVFQAETREWNARAAQTPPLSPAELGPRPRAPLLPDGGFSGPGNLYNTMIAPLMPYAIKGVIWYQGESNGDNLSEAQEYALLFPAMIRDWRAHWGQGDFPFLYVQLANFEASAKQPSENTWAWVRDAQLKTLALPATGMASAVDIGDARNIHPANKFDVGHRLALAARQTAYGEKNLVASGPLYAGMRTEGRSIRLAFRHCGGGLVSGPSGEGNSRSLTGFEIAGADQKFYPAQAVIDGNTVLVSSPAVPEPVAVRYAWANNPTVSLYNKEGLPASPFRTQHR
jgi:sialate O-acetylesterase